MRFLSAYIVFFLLLNSCSDQKVTWKKQSVIFNEPEFVNKITNFNHQGLFDSSILLVNSILNSNDTNPKVKFLCFLNLSLTYKQTTNYLRATQFIDSAKFYALQNPEIEKNIFEADFEKSMLLFDQMKYDSADSLIEITLRYPFTFFDSEKLSRIHLVKGYLFFLKKQYLKSLTEYNRAEVILKKSKPCDLPLAYAKKIQSYARLKEWPKVKYYYNLGMTSANFCNLINFKMYINHATFLVYDQAKKPVDALKYLKYFVIYKDSIVNYERFLNITETEKRELKKQTDYNLNKLKLQAENDKKLLLSRVRVALLILCLLIISVLIFNRNRKLRKLNKESVEYTTRLFEKIEEERKKIASDLHDSVSHDLISLKNKFVYLNMDSSEIDSILKTFRIIVRNLYPVLFEHLGLKESLLLLIDRLTEYNIIKIDAQIEYTGYFSVNLELQIFRIIQELLTNIIKHSGSKAAFLHLIESKKDISIIIRDTGTGFNIEEKLIDQNSFGLLSIIERTKILKGTISMNSTFEGSYFKIVIPKT